MVLTDDKSTSEQPLRKAKLPTLYERKLQNIVYMMFKVKNEQCSQSIKNLFSGQIHCVLREEFTKDILIPNYGTNF